METGAAGGNTSADEDACAEETADAAEDDVAAAAEDVDAADADELDTTGAACAEDEAAEPLLTLELDPAAGGKMKAPPELVTGPITGTAAPEPLAEETDDAAEPTGRTSPLDPDETDEDEEEERISGEFSEGSVSIWREPVADVCTMPTANHEKRTAFCRYQPVRMVKPEADESSTHHSVPTRPLGVTLITGSVANGCSNRIVTDDPVLGTVTKPAWREETLNVP